MRKKNNIFRNLLIAGGIAAAASGGCECPSETQPTPQIEEVRDEMRQSKEGLVKIKDAMAGYVERTDAKAEEAANERAAIGERIDGVQGEVTAARAEQATANENLGKKMQEGFDGVTNAVEEVRAELAGVGADINIVRGDVTKVNTRLDEAEDHRTQLEERINQRTDIYDFNDNYRLVVRPLTAEEDLISLFHNGNLVRKLNKRDAPTQGEMQVELFSNLYPDAGETMPATHRGGLYKGAQALEKSQALDGYLETLKESKGKDIPMGIVDAIFTGASDLDSSGWGLFDVFRRAGREGECLTALASKEISLPGDYSGRPNLRIKKSGSSYEIFSGDTYKWIISLNKAENKVTISEVQTTMTEVEENGVKKQKKKTETVNQYGVSMPERYIAWMEEAWASAFARNHDEVYKREDDTSRNTRRNSLSDEFDRGFALRAAGSLNSGEGLGDSRAVGEFIFSNGTNDENYKLHGFIDDSHTDKLNGDHRDDTIVFGKGRVDLKLGDTPLSSQEDKRAVLGCEVFVQDRNTHHDLAQRAPVVSTDEVGLYTTTETDLGGIEDVHDTHASYSIISRAGEHDFRLSFFNGSQRDHSDLRTEVDIVDNSNPTVPFIHHDIHIDSETNGEYEGAEIYCDFDLKGLNLGIFGSTIRDGSVNTHAVVDDNGEVTTQDSNAEYSQDGVGANLRMPFKDGKWRVSAGVYKAWADIEEDGVERNEDGLSWFAYSTNSIGNSVTLAIGARHNDNGDGNPATSGGSIVLGVDGSRTHKENVESIDSFLNNDELREWSSQYTPEAVNVMRRWERYNLMSEMNSRFILSLDFNEVYTAEQDKELAADIMVGSVLGGSQSEPAFFAVTFSEDPAYKSAGVDFVKKWKKGMLGVEYTHLDGKGGYDDDNMVGVVGGVTF